MLAERTKQASVVKLRPATSAGAACLRLCIQHVSVGVPNQAVVVRRKKLVVRCQAGRSIGPGRVGVKLAGDVRQNKGRTVGRPAAVQKLKWVGPPAGTFGY